MCYLFFINYKILIFIGNGYWLNECFLVWFKVVLDYIWYYLILRMLLLLIIWGFVVLYLFIVIKSW